MSNKLIRELRMGLHKSFKTGAVVGTYPKPMCCLSFDEEGLSVIPSRGRESRQPDALPFDCTAEDIRTVKPREAINGGLLSTPLKNSKVLCLDFCDVGVKTLGLEFTPSPNSQPMQDLVDSANALAMCSPGSFPFKTVVLDNVTSLQDVVYQHIAQANSKALVDARQWAGMIGAKVQHVVAVLLSLPCHVVILAHTAMDKNELTGSVTEVPNIYGKVRESIGRLFSQVLYSTKQGTKPVLWTTDMQFVRGIGCRWPAGLDMIIGASFSDVYGKEGLSI